MVKRGSVVTVSGNFVAEDFTNRRYSQDYVVEAICPSGTLICIPEQSYQLWLAGCRASIPLRALRMRDQHATPTDSQSD